ncbi:hypothetical protein E2C01_040618 [Portunus trituberculatus]|uniref:Uncharacterized protein n=1 Tax=Portunus trituberculatus TaxID=210409 RepID=A0A5B7FPP9_PORTR|nr:hypothetical protein [Portunus trituberculatus]
MTPFWNEGNFPAAGSTAGATDSSALDDFGKTPSDSKKCFLKPFCFKIWPIKFRPTSENSCTYLTVIDGCELTHVYEYSMKWHHDDAQLVASPETRGFFADFP